MAQAYNIIKVASSTTGTGSPVALGAARTGFLDFTAVPDGTEIEYTIEDLAHREVGRGVVSGSGTSLTRGTILSSTNGGSAINLTGNQSVMAQWSAESLMLGSPLMMHQNFGAT